MLKRWFGKKGPLPVELPRGVLFGLDPPNGHYFHVSCHRGTSWHVHLHKGEASKHWSPLVASGCSLIGREGTCDEKLIRLAASRALESYEAVAKRSRLEGCYPPKHTNTR